MIDRIKDSVQDLIRSCEKPRAEINDLASTTGWQSLVEILGAKAQQCEEEVTRFVRPDDRRTTEQIVIDNNKLVVMADALRFAPLLVEATLEEFSRKGRGE